MVQIIPAAQRKPTFGQRLSAGVGRGLEIGSQLYGAHLQQQQQQQQQQAVRNLAGEDVSKLPPELQKLYMQYSLEGQKQAQKTASELQAAGKVLRALEKQRGLEEGSLEGFESDVKAAELATRPAKVKEPALTEKPPPPEISKKIKKIIIDNPKATADELNLLMDEESIPLVYSNRYIENRRRMEEEKTKTESSRINALRQETLPLRTELAKKAEAAEKGIQNKEALLNKIETGDINDPTFAALAEALPLNLGKRMLSNDTVEYKAGLVEEFGDLRNIFQGQTRVKEIDLLENKIADIYLTDDQKKAILRSRINALKADVIRAQAAAELEAEGKHYGVLEYSREVESRAKPKLEALFHQILDDQKAVVDSAERRKQVALNPADSDDKKIMQQILKEAGGDKTKAKALAKKKGYSW